MPEERDGVGECSTHPSSAVAGKHREAPTAIHTVTVFVPRSLRKSFAKNPDADLLFGWVCVGGPRGDNHFLVVAGIVTSQQAASLLITPRQAVSTSTEGACCCILGSCSSSRQGQLKEERTGDRRSKKDFWIEVVIRNHGDRKERKRKAPEIASIKLPILSESNLRCATNVILYSVPVAHRMSYLSLEPMILPQASSAGVLDRSFEAEKIGLESKLQMRMEGLIRMDPLRHSDLSTKYPLGSAPGEGFRLAIKLLNQCSYLNDSIRPGVHDKIRGAPKGVFDPIFPFVFSLFRMSRTLCQGTRHLLTTRIRSVSPIDISASARQLDLRLGQAIIWPALGLNLRNQRRKDHVPVSNLAPRYVALYNGVWLVLNDLILGQAVGIWLCENRHSIVNLLIRWLRPILIESLIDTLHWLDDWPAGLKLNTQLSQFFKDMFVGLTMAWDDIIIQRLVANDGKLLGHIVYLTGLSSRLMGLTMLLSLLADFVQLLALHWIIYYRIQQAIFNFFVSSIVSLFYLFRGKKRNPLRKGRTDQATYELDQLLLGTIFFTLFVFLFLTVAVYYLHFSLLWLALIGVTTILQTGLAVLNHLPLFALMLRIKEPDRLPGGIEVRLCKDDTASNPLGCTYYELKSTPLGLSDVFRGYNNHLQAIREFPRLVCKVLVGANT